MILYNKSDLSHSVFASQGYGHKYVFPCAVALIELCSIFFFGNQETPCTCCKAQGALPPGRLWAHQVFFTYSVDTPATFSLHFMPLHLKKLHDSISSGSTFPPHQGLCHSETAFLPPSTFTSTQVIDAWSHTQLPLCYQGSKGDGTHISQMVIKLYLGVFPGTEQTVTSAQSFQKPQGGFGPCKAALLWSIPGQGSGARALQQPLQAVFLQPPCLARTRSCSKCSGLFPARWPPCQTIPRHIQFTSINRASETSTGQG